MLVTQVVGLRFQFLLYPLALSFVCFGFPWRGTAHSQHPVLRNFLLSIVQGSKLLLFTSCHLKYPCPLVLWRSEHPVWLVGLVGLAGSMPGSDCQPIPWPSTQGTVDQPPILSWALASGFNPSSSSSLVQSHDTIWPLAVL